MATKTLNSFRPKNLGNKEIAMGNRQRFTDEFWVEAVRQVTERGFATKDVSERLRGGPFSLYQKIKRYGISTEERLAKEGRAGRIKKLEAELRRVTEGGDILKKAAADFARRYG
jgi:transposase